MRNLHIVQGGIANGDKDWLEKAAKKHWNARTWVVPKRVAIGDEVVIYVAGYGFFATARVKSLAKPRDDWPNRYGSALESIKLIQPAISLGIILRRIPGLTWAKYPKSITTPSPEIADQIRKLIHHRQKSRSPEIKGIESLKHLNIDELRKAALLRARPFATQKMRKMNYRVRSKAIQLYVLHRANGQCEGCGDPAPFRKPDGSDYLEPHHTTRLADEGPDHPAKVIGLCPTCHRRAHYSEDAKAFNTMLIKKLRTLEREE